MIDNETNKKPQETAGKRLRGQAAALSANVASMAGQAAVLVGDLNGDGKVDEEDARIARDHAVKGLSVVRAPLTKDVATYAAVGAAIALPLRAYERPPIPSLLAERRRGSNLHIGASVAALRKAQRQGH
ncbi:MAG: hypothetical protein ABJA20_10650 [Novosphingobium sp.]